jgi:anti-sigma-K factor RskA
VREYSKDELMELAPGYALGALTPEEAAAVDAALARDPDLRREVAAYHDVAGTVLASEPPIAPPASLRARWLRRARGEEGVVGSRDGLRPPSRGAMPMYATRALGTLLAASLVVAVTLGVKLRDSTRALGDAQASLDAAHANLERRERQLNTVLEAESGLMVALLKPAPVGEAGVQVYWNTRQKRGMLHAFHLHPAPQGRAYQLWMIRDGKPVSMRVFNSDADGHALIEQLEMPETADGVSLVAITVEPEGGSPQPTTTPIMAGPLVSPLPKQ